MTGRLPRRVRVGAYAVAVNGPAVLLTKLSSIDPDRGRWILPGGGLEVGEEPEGALRREVFEETGLRGPIKGFLGVDSAVLPIENPRRTHETHSVHLIFRMQLGGEPQVIESDGSTEAAAWVPLRNVSRLPTVGLVGAGLALAGITTG